MIRRGRVEGWLKQPIDALPTWATFHGITFKRVRIGPLPGFEDRGSTVIATDQLAEGHVEPLLVVPKELIISQQNIELLSKADHHLGEVLNAIGDFGRTTRGVILTFLLFQATISCPEVENVGVQNPLTEYIKFLPDEPLPTLWSEDEQEFLTGTTLKPAVRAKLNSLLREFEMIRTTTEPIGWCNKYWWDEDTGMLTFDDWMRIDAMYRSRALELPGVGDCMMPCIDMANHASGDTTAAIYETDADRNGSLLLRGEKEISQGGEVTITYGDDKGACEMIFSYGFLEETVTSAKVMFLDMDIPDDDPLRPAKLFVSTEAPGFRIVDKENDIEWESDFIWLVVINEEDGLEFKIRQTIDGKRDIQALWKNQELDTSKLRENIQEDPAWDIYQLRAVVLVQERVETQKERLRDARGIMAESSVRDAPWRLAERLKTLELEMLERTVAALELQKTKLLESKTVQRYLGIVSEDVEDEEEDFS